MKNKKGMGSHQSAKMKNDEWLTPPEIISAMPKFDLDPCSPINRPWETARHHYTKQDDGLIKDWFGSVWCNPPYGKETAAWLKKMRDHNNGIALIFARTETEMFFEYVWDSADSLFFIKKRLNFHFVNGDKSKINYGAPSVLVAYGKDCSEILRNCKIEGKFINLKQ